MRKNLGEKLKEARENANLSQQDVADKLNVSRQTISKYELNINEPDLEIIKELSYLYQVDINYLLGMDEKTYSFFAKNTINKIFTYINIIIVFIAIIGSAIIIFKFLPETVALHYNFEGEVDRYGSKYELLLLNLILIILMIFWAFIYILVKRAVEEENITQVTRNIIKLTIQIVFFICFISFSVIDFYYIFKVSIIHDVGSSVSVVFIFLSLLEMSAGILSNPLFNKFNHFIGYRSKYALSNNEAWIKLNHCFSISLFVFSLISLIISIIFSSIYLVLLCLLFVISIVPPIIYQIYLRKSENKIKA